jgi:hypothetical protein
MLNGELWNAAGGIYEMRKSVSSRILGILNPYIFAKNKW